LIEVLVLVRPNGVDATLRETLETLREHTPGLDVRFREADTVEGAVEAPGAPEGRRVAVCVPADHSESAQAFVGSVIESLPDADVVLLDAGVSRNVLQPTPPPLLTRRRPPRRARAALPKQTRGKGIDTIEATREA
jgi:hypothetical protein